MKLLAISFMFAAIVIAGGYQFFSGLQRGTKINETWETTNGTFKVKVTSYAEENRGIVAGAFYVFKSSSAGSDDWHEIMTFRHDDPVAIPHDQVRFVNDQIGYIFMGWKYAVTTDAGSKWTVWTAEKDLPNWQCCNYRLIHEVRLAPDGTGTMILKPISQRKGEVPELQTKDFGQHWQRE